MRPAAFPHATRRDLAVTMTLVALALTTFLSLGAFVNGRTTPPLDLAVQSWMLDHQGALARRVFLTITNAGGISAMYLLALLVGAALSRRGPLEDTAIVLGSLAASVGVFAATKLVYARPRPVTSADAARDFSFPSGHATSSLAVCGTVAYVFWRQGLLTRNAAMTAGALVPLLVGVSRLYLNVHWTTDVLGGWCAGFAVAATGGLLHRRFVRRSPVQPDLERDR